MSHIDGVAGSEQSVGLDAHEVGYETLSQLLDFILFPISGKVVSEKDWQLTVTVSIPIVE